MGENITKNIPISKQGPVVVGTSGYSYTDWVGPVYPPELPRAQFLTWYARHLGFVELNFSYYKMPEAGLVERLAEATPEEFLFTVKAHRSMTHEKGPDGLHAAMGFSAALAPMIDSGKLGGILLQFPYSFHYTRENRSYLARLCTELQGLLPVLREPSGTPHLFIEFRHAEWQRERVYAYMRENGLGNVAVDVPALSGLPKLEAVATTGAAYLRLHGRNTRNWWTGDNATRYDYRYSDAELMTLLDTIRSLQSSTGIVFVALNNHFRGNAFDNAMQLRAMLT